MTLSIALAGAIALLLAYAVHCLTVYAMRHGSLPESRWQLVLRYGLGTGTIGVVFGVWCAVSGEFVALAAWTVIVVGAGLGTIAGHGLDGSQEKDRRIAYLERENEQLRRERGGK